MSFEVVIILNINCHNLLKILHKILLIKINIINLNSRYNLLFYFKQKIIGNVKKS